MANSIKSYLVLLSTLLIPVYLLINSCASVQAPTGGPRDTIPPAIVKETPKNLSKNFSSSSIEIEFDEYIKLTNEYTEISITPALEIPPVYKAKKTKLEIKFEKPLEEKTTYTINFGKAIADVNESNLLRNYTYVFATGDELDSLSLSGTVRNALTKEKLKDVTVFILPVSQDSLFGKKRASFFTTTDTAGFFSLKNLRNDVYHVYALDEHGGGDRIYNGQNEEIGFLNEPLVLDRNIDNIKLEVFKAIPSNFMVTDRKIEPDGRITILFNKPLIHPEIHILEPADLNAKKITDIASAGDSVKLWLPELTFDSLEVAISDSTVFLDTIVLRRNKRDTYNRVVLISDNVSGTKLKPKTDVVLSLSAPANTFQENLITLMEDSTEVKGYSLSRVENSTYSYVLKYPWRLNKEYTMTFKDNAFTDLFGNKSKAYIKRFSLDTEDSYGNMNVKITVPDTTQSYIVQWMNEREDIFRRDVISRDTTLAYLTYPTGKYRIRVIYDRNKNGRWDSGNVYLRVQPELAWTFDKTITLRANWDLEEAIIIPKAPQ